MEPVVRAPNSPTPRKKPIVPIIALVASILAVVLALSACGAAVYLFVENASLKSDLAKLEGDIDDIDSDREEDIQALKTDMSALKETKAAADAPVFKVASFDLQFDDGSYTDSYEGEGVLTCSDKSPYLALLKETLKSGGSASKKKINYYFIAVTDGAGEFTTYDWGDSGVLQRPDYEFEVIGYVKADVMPAGN